MDAVKTPNGAGYVAAVDALMDSEQWTRIFALERSVGNLDCYGNQNGQNMYAYRGANGTRWQLLLYDTELVFDCGGAFECPTVSVFSGISDPRIIDLLATNAFQRAYWRGFLDAVNGPMQGSNYMPVVLGNFDALSNNGVKKNNSRNPTLVSLSSSDLASITNWINDRWSSLTNQLGVKASIPLTITNATAGVLPRTSFWVVALRFKFVSFV